MRILISNYEIPPDYQPHMMHTPEDVQKLLAVDFSKLKVSPRRTEIHSENPRAYVIKIDHLPWGRAPFTIKRFRISKTDNFALVEEKTGQGGKFELSNPLPPAGVELIVLQQRKNSGELLKIVRLKTAVIEGNFDWTFVRLETDEGIQGLGECFFAPGLTAILCSLEPVLVGEDPRDIHRLFRKLQLATSGAGSVAGIIYNAISGIEAALWDVLGQALDVPIYRLLGGKFRDQIRIYADCHGAEALESLDEVLRSRQPSWVKHHAKHTPKDYYDQKKDEPEASPEDYAKRAVAMKSQGYTALKFDLDVPGTQSFDPYNRCLTNRAIDHIVNLIGAVRDAVGYNIDLAADCHWRYGVSDVIKVAHALESFRLLWLEDPVPPESVEALRAITSRVSVPIATGENLYLFEGFREVLQTHATGIVTPDLQKVGGLSIAQQIAHFADTQTIPMAPHNISSPVGTLAAAHFCAAIPNFLVLEFHASDVPFWNDLIEGVPKPIIQNGMIYVPEKSGLGVKLNEEVARKYARKGEPFFE